MSALPPRLLDGLFDDASQFPPGDLPLERALPAHVAWRDHPQAATVGRLIVPAARVPALLALLDDDSDGGLSLGIVARDETWLGACAKAAEAAAAVARDGRATVTAIEVQAPGLPSADALEAALAARGDAAVFVEPAPAAPWRESAPEVLEALATARETRPWLGAKLRCGGVRREAFPAAEDVAAFVAAAVAADVPFKATAGLHAPLPHWDASLGVRHHGFLTLWAATALAADGDPGLARACLEIDDPRQVEAADGRLRLGSCSLTHEALSGARRWFTAFGTCSIDEPLDGLAALGLLDAEAVRG